MGISGRALNWFKSYLEDRKYFVEIGNCVSDGYDLWGSPGVHPGTPIVQSVHAPIRPANTQL